MSEGSSSGKSSWSLPWGMATEEASAEPPHDSSSLLTEKSPEEIKTEVLKAAKERTKAKAKLFKKKDTTSGESVKSSDTEEKSVEDESNKLVEDSMSGLRMGPEAFSLGNVTECYGSSSDKEQFASNEKLVLDTSMSEETNTVCTSGFQEIDAEEAALLDVSSDVGAMKANSDSVSQPQDILASAQTNHMSDSHGDNERPETKSESEHVESDESINYKCSGLKITEVKSFSELSDMDSDREPLGTDISSSMEFVNKGDIPQDNKEVVEESSSSEPEMLDCDKQLCNKPETSNGVLDDCLGTSDTQNETSGLNFDASNSHIETSEVHIEPTDADSDHQSDPGQGPADEHEADELHMEESAQRDVEDISYGATVDNIINTVLQSQTDMLKAATEDIEGELRVVKSDSDMSVNTSRLDTSAETCGSEDTVVAEGSLPGEAMVSSSDSGKLTLESADSCTHLEHQDDTAGEDETSDSVKLPDTESECVFEHESRLSPDVDTGVTDAGLCGEAGDLDEVGRDLSPAHSFVKCMFEDGEGRPDDGCDSQSTEKSESSRSAHSSHESGDEVDTTTSSDIEIISLPTPNGENKQVPNC